MKAVVAILFLFGTAAFAEEEQTEGNPLGKVLQLLSSLQAKIVKEGSAEAKAYQEFFSWCRTQSQNLGFEIKTADRTKEKLTAKIDELLSTVEVSTTKIEELVGTIASTEAELKEATSIREQEASDYAASEKELVTAVDTLDRALMILSKQAAQGGAALAQIDTSSMDKMVQSMSAVVDAAGFEATDQNKLVAMLQGGDMELSAPSAVAYESQSSGITDVIEDMRDKAEGSLSDARTAESNGKHNFDILRQSLQNQVQVDTKDLDQQRAGMAAAQEEMAIAKGDLTVTAAELKENKKSLETARSDCQTTAADHEATVESRAEELKVITSAKKDLQTSTGGAETQAGYSFLQVTVSSKMRTRSDLADSDVLAMVRKLAKDHHSIALNQLASRVYAVTRYGIDAGQNPFGKIKGLLTDMIAKLTRQGASEATEKAYCDDQMTKTGAKMEDLESTTAKTVSKIDKAAARSAGLKEEVSELQSELADLSKSQAEMDRMRQAELADYRNAKSELQEGLSGVRRATGALRDYYGSAAALIQEQTEEDDDNSKFDSLMEQPAAPTTHAKASGAGGGIIAMLEIIESDFATNLAKAETQESDSADEYSKTTNENKVSKSGKETDVKYKTRESASLDKQISELSSDRENVGTETVAVSAYFEQIKQRCTAQPESHEERKARRDAEISGLKDALAALKEQSAFLQHGHRGLRGSLLGN